MSGFVSRGGGHNGPKRAFARTRSDTAKAIRGHAMIPLLLIIAAIAAFFNVHLQARDCVDERQQSYNVSDSRPLTQDAAQAPLVGNLTGEERQSVLAALQYIDSGVTPTEPLSMKWGAHFANFEGKLPAGVTYREYRVAPAPGTYGAGARRLVVGSDRAVYYTRDHYASFMRVR